MIHTVSIICPIAIRHKINGIPLQPTNLASIDIFLAQMNELFSRGVCIWEKEIPIFKRHFTALRARLHAKGHCNLEPMNRVPIARRHYRIMSVARCFHRGTSIFRDRNVHAEDRPGTK